MGDPSKSTAGKPQPDVSTAAFRRYLEGVRSAATARKYSRYADKFLELMAENGYETFDQIPRGFLNSFASMLLQQRKSASTVRVQYFAVKRYLDWVRDQGIDVARQAKPDLPRMALRMRSSLAADEISEFFRQADVQLEEPLRTAVMLLPCCGLRASEMVSLKHTDIHRAMIEVKGKKRATLYLRVRGKGDTERHVPLLEEGVEILTGYLAGWRRHAPGPWLFPSTYRDKVKSKGKRHFSDRSLRSGVSRVCEAMGLDFTPHTMRRTYITYLWRKGVNLATIARIAGHANVQTTINHYIVMEPQDALQAVRDAGSITG